MPFGIRGIPQGLKVQRRFVIGHSVIYVNGIEWQDAHDCSEKLGLLVCGHDKHYALSNAAICAGIYTFRSKMALRIRNPLTFLQAKPSYLYAGRTVRYSGI